jgi:hypothetical protein
MGFAPLNPSCDFRVHAAEDEIVAEHRADRRHQAGSLDETIVARTGVAGERIGERMEMIDAVVIREEKRGFRAQPQQIFAVAENLVGVADIPRLARHLRIRQARHRETEQAGKLHERRHGRSAPLLSLP